MRTTSGAIAALLALIVGGCENNKTSKVDELMSANQVRTEDPIPAEAPPPSFDKIPPITIDNLGVKIGGRGGSDLHKEKNRKKLKEVVDAIPHKGKPVKIVALQKAKIVDVVETVWLLGEAGVNEVIIQTKPKSNGKACNTDDPPADQCLPGTLTVVPASKLAADPPKCSTSITITGKNHVGVWGFGETGGRRHRPGFGGADLSSAQETVEKRLRSCKSEYAFFTADYKMNWENAYNAGATIRFMDKKNKIKKLVLLDDAPVAGRPIKLRK